MNYYFNHVDSVSYIYIYKKAYILVLFLIYISRKQIFWVTIIYMYMIYTPLSPIHHIQKLMIIVYYDFGLDFLKKNLLKIIFNEK